MYMFNEMATTKMARAINKNVRYEIGIIDSFKENELSTEMIIYDRTTGEEKKYEFYIDYDLKEKTLVLVSCANQNSITEKELKRAYLMVELLNHEIKATIEFMDSLF